ncbi:hypothetical protein [Pseudomaricurvus sp.]|uniref:hypothetical protein n=1 Tax=Pseudomaricurvus sp. TaxID=2004510 RepID=UPI003F6D9BBB
MRNNRCQDTFLSCADLLKGEADRCEIAERDLRVHMQSTSEPFAMTLQEIADLEREMVTLMRSYAARGPTKVVETRLQYTADSGVYEDPKTPESALVRLTAVNKEVSDKLFTAINNDIPQEIAEELDTLWRNMETLGLKISMMHVTTQDV